MKLTQLCFIGAGFQASTNILPSALKAGAEIKALATRDIERSKSALQRFGSNGTPYCDYKLMLQNEDCDGVVVVAQPGDQVNIVMDCIRCGKNVFVEKPLGWNAEEATLLSEAAEQMNTILMVGFMKRFAPCYLKLHEVIKSGSLGTVRSFQMRFAVDSTPFCKNEDEFIKLVAIHFIDLVRYLFGEVSDICGFSNSKDEFISQTLSLLFANGVVGSAYFTGMSAWSRESERITVTFDNGFVCTDGIATLTIHESLSANPDILSWQSLAEKDTILTPTASTMSGPYKDLYLRGFIGEMNHFMLSCINKTPPISNGKDNVATMILCDRILSALKT